MAKDLVTYLEGRESQGFNRRPSYSNDGDFLTFFFRDEDHFAERVDDLLTVYLSMDTEELVGCKIKGVRHTLETLGNFGVIVDDGDLQLSFLFLPRAFAAEGPQKQRYEEVGAKTKGVRLSRQELQPA